MDSRVGNQSGDDEVTVATVAPKANRLRWLGIGLIVLSFMLYGGLLLVPFLALDASWKVGISFMLVVLGEASFWIGGAIVGRELVVRYRRYLNPRNWGKPKVESEK